MSTIVPFGPQHPVLPEPIQLCLELEDERVVSVIPVVGYVHRGLEKIAEQKDFVQDTYLIERICGICAFGHSMGYAETVERLMGIEIPEGMDSMVNQMANEAIRMAKEWAKQQIDKLGN